MQAERADARQRFHFRVAFAALALWLFGALMGARDLPMLDLPQHASQISTWYHFSELPEALRARIELNFRTPYLLAYPLARALTPLLGVLPALKLLVWAAAVANVVVVAELCRRLGHDARLALLALPCSFGYCFYFGFLSFLLAMPLALTLLLLALAHGEKPSLLRGSALAFVSSATLVAHGFAFGVALSAALPMLLFAACALPETKLAARGRSLAVRLAPLLAPLALASLWLAPGSALSEPPRWTIEPGRSVRWLTMITGVGSYADVAAIGFGVAVLAALALSLGRSAAQPPRWALLAIAVLGYALVPEELCGTAFLHQRFVAFLLPALLLAFRPRSAPTWRVRAARLALPLCVAWLALFSWRLARFQREMADFHAIDARLPAGLRLRPIIFARDSSVFPGVPAFLHVSAYYHVEKGGMPAYSFAGHAYSVVRYRPLYHGALRDGLEWQPEAFDARTETLDYDYFLVRGANPRESSLFADSPVPIALDACVGEFCGYRRVREQTRPRGG